MATSPVLDLTTLLHRETVRIDGVRYDLKNDKELSIFDLARLERTAARIQAIDGAEATSPEQRADYDRLLEVAVRLVLVAPDAVHAALKTAHREAILWTFIRLSRPSLAPTRETRTETPTRPIAKTASRSARGSRASTAARRRAG